MHSDYQRAELMGARLVGQKAMTTAVSTVLSWVVL